MTTSAYEQILAVQAIDLRLLQLRHRVEQHPLRAELLDARAGVDVGRERLAKVEARYHEIEREQKRLSDEAATIEAKRAEIEGKLYDGSVQATKELMALQDESANLLKRQTSVEDDQLEGMEQLETVGDELAAQERALAELTERADAIEGRLDDAVAELEAEIGQAEVDRVDVAGPADPELLATYEALAPQFDGAPLARFADGRCDGCHMQLSAVAVDQLLKAPENEAITCEECGRLLVR